MHDLNVEQASDLVRYFLGARWEALEVAAGKLVVCRGIPFPFPTKTWEQALRKAGVTLPPAPPA